jgi:hypothetical protein
MGSAALARHGVSALQLPDTPAATVQPPTTASTPDNRPHPLRQVRELNGNLAPRAPAPRPPKGRASLENNIRQGRDLESLDLFGFGMDV